MRLFDRECDGVLFDMDGLMLDTERISMRAWQAGCAEAGHTLTDAQFLDIIGHRESDCLALIKNLFGADIDVNRIAASTRRHYAKRLEAGVPVMPGLTGALEELSAAGIPLAVATSTHHDVATAKLAKAGIGKYFRAIVGGDLVAHGKPAPDLYVMAAALAGVAPERCIALEDSGPGLRAAHAAGCAAVLIPDLKPPTPEIERLAHRVLGSMSEFEAEVKRARRV